MEQVSARKVPMRSLILNTWSMSRALNELKTYGPGVNAVYYHLGFRLGSNDAEIALKSGEAKPMGLRGALERLSRMGLGVVQPAHVNISKGIIRVAVFNGFESEMYPGKASEPCCHFTRGYLAGYVGKIIGIMVSEIHEVKCRAAGDRYCEFEMRLFR
mgnify:CR=1 FL=1